jgi:hypothetical protein
MVPARGWGRGLDVAYVAFVEARVTDVVGAAAFAAGVAATVYLVGQRFAGVVGSVGGRAAQATVQR